MSSSLTRHVGFFFFFSIFKKDLFYFRIEVFLPAWNSTPLLCLVPVEARGGCPISWNQVTDNYELP